MSDTNNSWEEKIGNKIRQLRGDKTKKDFAEMMLVTSTTISNWESGRKIPQISTLRTIAEKGNVSMDWLLGLSEKKKPNAFPETYEEWIKVIEKLLNNKIIDEYYHIEMVYANDYFGIEKGVPETSDIYDASADFENRHPDIMEIQDTFLKCILAKLSHYRHYKTEEEYESFKNDIINKYGSNKLLNFSVHNLKKNSYRFDMFGKYHSVSELELKVIWDKLQKLILENPETRD